MLCKRHDVEASKCGLRRHARKPTTLCRRQESPLELPLPKQLLNWFCNFYLDNQQCCAGVIRDAVGLNSFIALNYQVPFF